MVARYGSNFDRSLAENDNRDPRVRRRRGGRYDTNVEKRLAGKSRRWLRGLRGRYQFRSDGRLSGLTMLDKSRGSARLGRGNRLTSTHASSRGNLPGIKLASGETKHRDAYGKETSFSYIRGTDKRPRLSPTDLSTVISNSPRTATHSQFVQLSAPAFHRALPRAPRLPFSTSTGSFSPLFS